MRKFFLTVLIISSLFIAFPVFAQIDLEQTYPEVPVGDDTTAGRCCQDTPPNCSGGYDCEGGGPGCDPDNPDGICVSPMRQTITGKTSLPALIKYFANWALILAALAVVISLIIGGIQYLTASGRPEKMTDARKKISNSFLGLAILAGSYLILVTINPQLTVMSLVISPVDSGVVLLTEAGYRDLSEEKNLHDIFLDGNAKIFTNDSVDLTQEKDFGPLVFYDGKEAIPAGGTPKLNFANFPIYAIAFFGKDGSFSDNVKIVAYDDKHFKQSDPKEELNPREYTRSGKLDKEGSNDAAKGFRGAEPATVGNLQVAVVWVEEDSRPSDAPPAPALPTDFFLSKVEYVAEERSEYLQKVAAGQKDFPPAAPMDAYHPPLSIAIRGLGPGVYLYSDTGEQRYILSNHDDFNLSDMKFDNLADRIEVNNYEKDDYFKKDEPDKNKPTHNFLVVLHDYYHFHGNLRLFFTKTKEIIGGMPFVPKIYLDGEFNKKEKHTVLCNKPLDNPDANGETCKEVDADANAYKKKANGFYCYDNCPSGANRYMGKTFRSGNIDLVDANDAGIEYKTRKIGINDVNDVYGNIKSGGKTSSMQIFEIIPPIKLTDSFEWSDFKSSGDRSKECREVRLCTKKGGAGDCISYTPGGKFFVGANDSIHLPMPYFVPVNIPHKLTGIVQKNDGTLEEADGKRFADNIKSLYMRGDCLVVLFENRLTKLEVDDHHNLKGSWEGGVPGSHSETFLKSDFDLTNNEIARCGSARGRLGMSEPKGCASAIAVFPIRVLE